MKRGLLYRILLAVYCLIAVFSCASEDAALEPIDNQYRLDDAIFEIRSNMYWKYSGAQGGIDEIRLLEPVPEELMDNMIIIKPVPGPADLQGVYTYSKTGAVGTYDINFIHGIDTQGDFIWNTNGDFGQSLEIKLVDNIDGQKVYRIILADFTLNYGFWDYLAATWVSMGQKSFQLSYQGPIVNN